MGRSDTVVNWKEPPKPLVGAVRMPQNGYDVDEAGQPFREGWALTHDVAALLLPADEVAIGATFDAIRNELNERYPSPDPGLSRVVENTHQHSDGGRRFEVFTRSVVSVGTYRALQGDLERIQELAAAHGPLLISAADRQKLLDTGYYSASQLCAKKLNYSMYAVSVDAKKAAGRAKGQETREKKRREQRERDRTLYEMRRTFGEIRSRTLTAVLAPVKELPLVSHGVPKLQTVIAVGERLIGKQFYRKVEGFDVFLNTWRGWDRKLAVEALTLTEEDVHWLDAEAAAMVRRDRKRRRAEARRQQEAEPAVPAPATDEPASEAA